MNLIEVIWSVPIQDGVLRFLGDGSVASVGGTCSMLYKTTRDELELRARHYLKSNDSKEHKFYPVQGYYGIWEYGDGDCDQSESKEQVLWIRCACNHHEHEWNLFRKQDCLCEF